MSLGSACVADRLALPSGAPVARLRILGSYAFG